jgi:hypothetical protein
MRLRHASTVEKFICEAQAKAKPERPSTGEVYEQPSDRYTLFAVTAIKCLDATLDENLNFEPIRDFAPLAGTFLSPNVIAVKPSVPARRFRLAPSRTLTKKDQFLHECPHCVLLVELDPGRRDDGPPFRGVGLD